MLNRFVNLCLGLLACATTSLHAQSVTPDKEGMDLDALDWTKEIVMGWNLGNSLECPTTETEWGNPKTTREMIQKVREAGFNGIRIPVRWAGHVTNTQTMAIDATWSARVKEVVDWCLAEGMYVIINDHHEEWYDRNPFYSTQAENNRKLKALWTNIATYFRDYGERLIFAGTNETTVNWSAPTQEQQAVQNSYNQAFVDAVRATGGKNYYRNLVVQTFACSPYHGLNGFTIPADKVENRLSVEFHYYDPYQYAGSCEYYYWGNAYKDKGKILTSDTEVTQANLFDRIRSTWAAKGLGVVIGEYGVANHYTEADKQTQQENMQYYLKTLVGNARQRGFAAFVWDNNAFNNGAENFGIFKRWQNMAVGNTYFLKGISQGAGVEYKEPDTPNPDDPEYGEEGKVIWEGDALLDWGNSLQLTIPATEFTHQDNTLQVILTYTQDYTDYDQIQIFYGDWSQMTPFSVGDGTFDGAFIPSQYYATGSGAKHVTPVTFGKDAFTVVQQKGIVIQGHGVRLQKVTLYDPIKASVPSIIQEEGSGQGIYSIDGKSIDKPQHGQVYIKNRKKYIAD
ncbi:MAG: glycoside hydrolase family 5 protein [Prevotella sp.]|nr:glycoside hydrolase family 5 protein [Prevotella sp.]